MAKVFVVIVTYNGLEWYDRCFGSLRKSSVPVEVIVVDNKSSDNTVSYIKENYPEICLIESEKNLGFGKANNIGIELALNKGADYVFLLNQDAWVFSDTLGFILEEAQRNSGYGVFSPLHLGVDEKKLEDHFEYYLKSNTLHNVYSDEINNLKFTSELFPIDFVNAAAWLLTSECLREVGGFNPIYHHYAEDVDYVNRLHYHKLKVGVCTKAKVVHASKKKQRLSLSEQKKQKKHYGPWINTYLKHLSNINITTFKAFVICLYIFIKELIRHIAQLNRISIYYDFVVAVEAIGTIPKVIKSRGLAKKNDYAFLNFN